MKWLVEMEVNRCDLEIIITQDRKSFKNLFKMEICVICSLDIIFIEIDELNLWKKITEIYIPENNF